MKKIFLMATMLLMFGAVNAQKVVVMEGNGKVVIRTESGSYVSTVESSGAADAALNSAETEVVVTYDNGKVVVWTTSGSYVSTVESSNARSARWSGNDIIVTYNDGKVVKWSKSGSYISTIKS